ETLWDLALEILGCHIGDAGGAGAGVAEVDHGVDFFRGTGKEGLDRAVGTVTHPAVEAELLGLLHGPGAVPDVLHLAADDAAFGNVTHQASSTITWSTERLSPDLAWIFATLPSRSARRMFIIFIASTTHSS